MITKLSMFATVALVASFGLVHASLGNSELPWSSQVQQSRPTPPPRPEPSPRPQPAPKPPAPGPTNTGDPPHAPAPVM
jgi:serine protease